MSDDTVLSANQVEPSGDITVQGSVSGTGIAIGHGASVTIKQIVRGLEELPTRYDGFIQNFLEYYLGTESKRAPFGGRTRDLDALNSWLNYAASPPYATLIAPAGRGKSALLAYWITQLVNDELRAPHVVYFPISIRFGTNLEVIAFASIAARIAYIHGEKVVQAFDPHLYRGVFADLVRRAPVDGRPVLVVIDGVDEAAGWDIGAGLFPTVPPPHLRVVIAARPLAGDVDGRAWLGRLGWESTGIAHQLSLSTLDRAGVADVMQQMGNPLDRLATKIDVVGKLHELSEGDPLLVRLYIEALLPLSQQSATLTPDDLLKLSPGLSTYFQRWYDEQLKLWGTSSPLKDKAVRAFLNLLAVALGPLSKDDVLTLAHGEIEDSLLLNETARSVSRFVIGDGQINGYVFGHPRFGEFFAQQLSPGDYQAWQTRFLKYGMDTLIALTAGTLLPRNAPPYNVRNYGTHLAKANAPASDFFALMCEGWLRAREWVDGTLDGFLSDAHSAWTQAEFQGMAAIGQMVRAVLCISSARSSMHADIPNDLLLACLQAEVLSPRLALVLARAKQNIPDQINCVARVSTFLPSTEQHAIITEVLLKAHYLSDERLRLAILLDTSEQLSPELQRIVMTEAINVARAISNPEAWKAVAMQISPSLSDLFLEVLNAIRAIESEYSRADILSVLAAHLSSSEIDLLDPIFDSVSAIKSDEWRVHALRKISERVPSHAPGLLNQVMGIVRSVDNEQLRTEVLCVVVEKLSKDYPGFLNEALLTARAVDDKVCRVGVLSAVAKQLKPENQLPVLTEALQVARGIEIDRDRAKSLCIVATGFSLKQRVEILAEALQTARSVQNDFDRVQALCAVAEELPLEERQPVLAETLSIAESITHQEQCITALQTIARTLPKESAGLRSKLSQAAMALSLDKDQFKKIFQLKESPIEAERVSGSSLLARAALRSRAKDKDDHVQFLLSSIEGLAPDKRKEVLARELAEIRAIHDVECRVMTLCSVAQQLLPKDIDLLREVLISINALKEPDRAKVLLDLAAHVPSEAPALFADMLNYARDISDKYYRAYVLATIAGRLPATEQKTVLTEALNIARVIYRTRLRARILGTVAAQLSVSPTDLSAEVIALANAIEYADDRAEALSEVAGCVPPDERRSMFIRVFESIRTIHTEEERAKVLMTVVRRVPVDAIDLCVEVLNMISTLHDQGDRAKAMIAFTEHLPSEPHDLLAKVIPLANTIDERQLRARVLSTIAKISPLPQQRLMLTEALDLARSIVNCHERVQTLCFVSDRLPPAQQVTALADALNACKIDREEYVTDLRDVVIRLPVGAPELFAKAVSATRVIKSEMERSLVLTAITERLSLFAEKLPRNLLSQFVDTLHSSANLERFYLLQTLETIAPVIHRLGGEQAIRETAQAIIDTAQWWP
jgi:hypothetical protein